LNFLNLVRNGLDAAISIATVAVPGFGWAIGATYFFANAIWEGTHDADQLANQLMQNLMNNLN